MELKSLPAVNKRLLISVILIGMTLLVYWPVTRYPFINFDDGGYVFKNFDVQGALTLKKIGWAFTTTQLANWHPLTWLSYLMDYQLFGLNAGGYHLTNLFFHLANSILLFLLLARMTKGLWAGALVAALFAVHPLHVESVAWIAERKDVLSAFFWILSMITYVYYVERPSVYRYVLVLLTFISGLMAKPMVVTLPFVLILLDYWPLGRFPIGRAVHGRDSSGTHQRKNFSFLLLEKLPLLIFSVASSVMTFYAQQSAGAVNQEIPLAPRISNIILSYISYLEKMFWPLDLSIFYPFSTHLPLWQIIGSGFVLVGISFGVMWKLKRYPYLAVGWLWFLGTLVPVIGLVQVGSQALADRYTYIPYIGLFVMITWGISDLLFRWSWKRIFLGFMAGILLSILSILSWVQVNYWENSITLFQHALKVSAENYKAHDILGVTLMEQGKWDEAVFHFREAIRLRPNYGSAYNNMGVALEKQGKVSQAMAQYSEALRVRPGFSEAQYNLGIIEYRQGNLEEAKVHFRAALRINHQYAEAYNNLAVVLLSEGKIGEAINQLSEALKITPSYADAHYNLGRALACVGKIEEAMGHYREALRIQPGFQKALNSLKLAQEKKNKPEEKY